MDKETHILSRLAANHLHLAQFEPLKATLLALRVRNPDLALTILQTIVSNAGRFENVLWSPSCPSPSLLAFLSTIELLRFENPTSPWGFNSETLCLRADFLLMVQVLIDRVTERIGEERGVELESERVELEEKRNKELEERDENGELRNCVGLLQGFLEIGVERLKFDADRSSSGRSYRIEEEALVSLRSIVLDFSDVFDALCCNIRRQLVASESYDTSFVGVIEREDHGNEATGIDASEEDNNKLFALIQRYVQLTHLDAMKKCLEVGDEHGAADHIRFLHLDYGVEKENYQYVLVLFSPQMHKVFESYHCSTCFVLFTKVLRGLDYFVVPFGICFSISYLRVFARI